MTDANGTSFQEKPMVETYAPPRYPSVNWDKPAEVRECWLPDEKPVGWLIIQDEEAISWLSSAGPDRVAAYAAKGIVQETLRRAFFDRLSAREAFDLCTDAAMFRASELMEMKDMSDRLSKERS